MRIVAVNKFHYLRGGAERYFFEVNALLRQAGHEVFVFSMHDPRNEPSPDSGGFVSRVDFERGGGPGEAARATARVLYSFEARRRLGDLLRRVRPALVHHHNIAHHLSPAVVDAAAAEGTPQVQTLHDYKLLCPVYVLMRDGQVCEECRGAHFEPVLKHRCNRGSLLRSAVNYVEMTFHESRGTYRQVDRFICPSSFQRETVHRFGWPESRTAFVPHYVRTAGIPVTGGRPHCGGYLGRLSHEKGLLTLMEALRMAAPRLPRDWEFLVAGDGPLRAALEKAAEGLPVRFLGQISGQGLEDFWASVRFTVMPSIWYEVRPIALHEAFARGKGAIGSDLGSIPELVREGDTGLLALPGDASSWALSLERAYGDPARMLELGRNARRFAETELTPERHLETLLGVYREVAA